MRNTAGGDGGKVIFHRATANEIAVATGGGTGRNLVQGRCFNELERVETSLDVNEVIVLSLFGFWPRKK